MSGKSFTIKNRQTVPDYRIISREFYIKLQEQIKAEYPDEYYTYEIGGYSFKSLAFKVKALLKKELKTDIKKDILNKIDYLIDNNYINI